MAATFVTSPSRADAVSGGLRISWWFSPKAAAAILWGCRHTRAFVPRAPAGGSIVGVAVPVGVAQGRSGGRSC